MTYETFLEEAFDLSAMTPAVSKKADLFLGRYQPVHIGHAKIIESMHNPVVAVVKGEKSSADKSRNPLSAEYQIKLLKKIAPSAKIITVLTGYIPQIIDDIRKEGLEVTKIYAGADRIAGYRKMVDSANSKLDPDKQMHVTFEETPRYTSATTVRNAIRSGDEAEFKKNMPKVLWTEFNTLKTTLGESIISFSDWLYLKESYNPEKTI